ncbi:CGNR zinc finger domain-containing protein [Micromonospora yasonensis]|uniref:CGNR zinc finger domain-containing protein n=1 Tax=Micromonospora yasonensis TaxID=1128667 RepID=UPI00223280CA|nr:CGNR zinc finger domain-containing protein [Micromonospora yasonensis]MCW3839010.1 CGNR zinc finger domain-containing protein [Micromonospora yasonensis]
MQFNHDNMTGARLAADLANLVVEGRPGMSGVGAGEIEAVLCRHEIRRPSLTTRQAEVLRVWGVRLRGVFEARGTDERCAAINALLGDGTAGVFLTTHDGLRPHLHFTPEDDDVVGRVRAVTAGGLAIFAVEAEGRRLGVCARSTCVTVFLDTSRNGRREYCSARCGNHDAVHRHRTQRRAGR